jgi:hypothetical protein
MTDPTSDDGPLPSRLGHLLYEAVDALTHARELELSRRRMTEHEWLVLRTLAEAGPVGLPKLMGLLHHFAFFRQVPQLLEQLREQGWMEERTEGPTSVSVFALTPAGFSQSVETVTALEAIWQRAVDGLPGPAQDTVVQFLQGAVARLRNPAAEGARGARDIRHIDTGSPPGES